MFTELIFVYAWKTNFGCFIIDIDLICIFLIHELVVLIHDLSLDFTTSKVDCVDAFLGQLKEELDAVEAENNEISNEVEVITRSIMAGKNHII